MYRCVQSASFYFDSTYVVSWFVSHADTDECKIECICGGGKCVNYLKGFYYTCVCDDGFELTGDAASHSLTCTGRSLV